MAGSVGPATLNVLDTGELAHAYERVRNATLSLTRRLSPEDQMVQSMPDASPTKWHLAHTTWFFETFVLASHRPGYSHYNPDFAWIFNSYYKQLGAHPNRGTRGNFSRPSLDEVLAYRRFVDEHMLSLLKAEVRADVAGLVTLGLNHEQQHQELIVTDIKHAFWSQPLRPAYVADATQEQTAAAVDLNFCAYTGGVYDIGHVGPAFAFDNESPRHQVLLQPYRIASRLVTNSEYLEYMADGGYLRPELWLSDGWDLVCQNGWRAPLYWENEGDGWRVFTSSGMRSVAPNEPVCHVSYYEADAYARWAGARLPLEAEWEVAASSLSAAGNFAERGMFHPTPAGDASSPSQMFGDVWEWTSSPYLGYSGFKPVAGAIGEYNGKFMCNQFVLRGGSCATPQSHIRATYRNFFPPHARWQFMGIRLATDER